MTDLFQIAAKIGLSAVLAGAVGAEREITGKWAGMRTHMLIAVGSALLTDLSVQIGAQYAQGSQAWDPGRIAAQIVSGVGFIGAGTIIQSRGTVHGLTTAAGLWVASAIGMAVGASFYAEALVGTAALLLILAALKPVERYLFGNRQTVIIELAEDQTVADTARAAEAAEIESPRLRLTRDGPHRAVVVTFKGDDDKREEFLRKAADAGLAAKEE